MTAIPDTARLFATVTRLREEARRAAERVIAGAHAARQRGATAKTYQVQAQQLDIQANRAGELLLGWAAKASRAAAVEKRFIADALEVIEDREDV